jgi:hypothetical protein
MPPARQAPPTGGGATAHGQPPAIISVRLRLDRLRAADVDAFFSYRSRPEVCRYQSFEPAGRAEAAAAMDLRLSAAEIERIDHLSAAVARK